MIQTYASLLILAVGTAFLFGSGGQVILGCVLMLAGILLATFKHNSKL